jgi:protease-4
MHHARRALAVLLASLAPAACGPVTLSVTLFDEGRELEETVVAEDERPGSDKVALIDVRGVIADNIGGGLLGDAPNPVDELTARLDKAAQDRKVKAVVLRINSPGGTVGGSEMMYREVRRFAARTGKPVVASFGEVAASGGYFLALAADEIVAEPTSITASIGVIIPTVNVHEGLGRIGVRTRAITSGPNKAMGDPLSEPRESHYELLQGLVDEFYDRFRSLVVERRPTLDPGLVDELTDGRVVTGARAVETGLADTEGGLREAFEVAKRRADIDGARLVKYHARGDDPRSPYASAPATAGPGAAGGAASQINLLQINGPLLGDAAQGGAYYLWAPGLE